MIRETTGTPSSGMTYPGLRTGGCYPATPSPVAVRLLSTPEACHSTPPPLTHQAFMQCHTFAIDGPRQPHFVQVKSGLFSSCARILDAWITPDGQDMWNLHLLRPYTGIRSYPVSRIVKCSGVDGKCLCAGERA